MTEFTTPEPDAPEAAQEPVAPLAVVAPPIEAKPKAKRKRKKAAKKRAPRTKKQPASMTSEPTPSAPLPVVATSEAQGAAVVNSTVAPSIIRTLRARATEGRDGILSLRAHGIGPIEQIVAAAAIVVLMATGAYACSFFG